MGNRGHHSGIIRNNIIFHDDIDDSADVGIGLENATNVAVYNNTIYFENSYPNAIEYRFSNTSALITNNLTNKLIQSRDGGNASLETNYTTASAAYFNDLDNFDLHLVGNIDTVIDTGVALVDLIDDFDGDSRPQGNGIDIGADEYIQ